MIDTRDGRAFQSSIDARLIFLDCRPIETGPKFIIRIDSNKNYEKRSKREKRA